MDELQPLLGTTLILMAHPDDEIIICGALMQKMKAAIVVFATDGAPRDQGFWKQYGSRQAYADVRRAEARKALALVGAQPIFLPDRVQGGIADQELFRNLSVAIAAVKKIVDEVVPGAILVPAYEGGHPDHDAACFIGSIVGRHTDIPVWESPLYHRKADGSAVVQAFPRYTGGERELRVAADALAKKARMFEIYRSQNLVLDQFHPERETFRPLHAYDFTVPPLHWKLNYELWEWKMTGQEVSTAFADYLQSAMRSANL
jgi:LmbE family N-acetylglucosaminyl deacetylase